MSNEYPLGVGCGENGVSVGKREIGRPTRDLEGTRSEDSSRSTTQVDP